MKHTIFTIAALLVSQAAFASGARANRDPAQQVVDPVAIQAEHGKAMSSDLAGIADSPATITVDVQGRGPDTETKITN